MPTVFEIFTAFHSPEVFEPFLKSYFEHYKFQSLDSNDFKDFFTNYFKKKSLSCIDWEKWFKQPGMPIYEPNYDQSLFNASVELAQKWVTCPWGVCPFTSDNFSQLLPEQKVLVLDQLLEEEPLSVEKLSRMQEMYKLNDCNNSEIRFKWIRLCLKGRWKEAVSIAVQMVSEHGRLKFLRPIYRYALIFRIYYT